MTRFTKLCDRNRMLSVVLCLAIGLAALPGRSGFLARPVSAQPPAQLPLELQYVPADAGMFAHAEVAKLWSGPIGKSIRSADEKFFADLTAQAKALFGVTPDQVQSLSAFWPKMKGPGDEGRFGVVLTFTQAYDAAKLKAGVEKLLGPEKRRGKVISPSDRVAVVLVELDDGYAKVRPASETGPLTATIREVASGKHLLAYGTTLASLPDEIRGDNLPEEVRPFKPLLQSESVSGFLTLGKDMTVEFRVKATSGPKAVEAEKSLGFLATMLQQQIDGVLKSSAPGSPTLEVMRAVQTSLKGAKFETTGEQTKATLKLPADLPFGKAFTEGVMKVRGAAARAQSTNNLKQIALALHNYHDTFKSMPPAAVVDKKARPMLSWRVLILPYIEQNDLYKQFKLDEPWDSPNNIKLLDKMPKVYALPTRPGGKANETHYRVFVGNGAAWDYLKGPKLTEFADGTSNTFLVVTAAKSVPWTKPDELDFDPDKDMKQLLDFLPSNVCMVAFGDGSVRAISKSVSQKTLNAVITRSGGEVIGDDF